MDRVKRVASNLDRATMELTSSKGIKITKDSLLGLVRTIKDNCQDRIYRKAAKPCSKIFQDRIQPGTLKEKAKCRVRTLMGRFQVRICPARYQDRPLLMSCLPSPLPLILASRQHTSSLRLLVSTSR